MVTHGRPDQVTVGNDIPGEPAAAVTPGGRAPPSRGYGGFGGWLWRPGGFLVASLGLIKSLLVMTYLVS